MRSRNSNKSRGSNKSSGSRRTGKTGNDQTIGIGDEESGFETMQYQGEKAESDASSINTDSEAEYVSEEEERPIPESTFDSDDYLLHL